MWQEKDDCRTCMCVRQTQNVELACVTETLIMCVAERRDAGRAYMAEREREVNKKVDALRPVNQYGYIRATSDRDTAELSYVVKRKRTEICDRQKETAKLRCVAERRRLLKLDTWHRERGHKTQRCSRENEATERRYVADRMKPQDLDMWRGERDCRTQICGREKETAELRYVVERMMSHNLDVWQ